MPTMYRRQAWHDTVPVPPPSQRIAEERERDLGPFTGILVALALVGGIVLAVVLLHWWLT